LIGIQSLWDGTQYVTSLQMGMKGTTGVYLNGLIIDIVPEPATMSLLGLGVLGLIRRK
jgi:hypothetical protein